MNYLNVRFETPGSVKDLENKKIRKIRFRPLETKCFFLLFVENKRSWPPIEILPFPDFIMYNYCTYMFCKM
jgi:hypothetical protein